MKRKILSVFLVTAMAFSSFSFAFADSTYTVKSGDVLWKIAKQYGMTWQSLAEFNKLADPNLILPGQKLTIPDKTAAPATVAPAPVTPAAAPAVTTPVPAQSNPNAALEAALSANLLNDPVSPVSGLSVLAMKNGKVVYEKQMGYRYIDNENPANSLPVNEDTRFRIASISKVFAAVGFMKLVEAGSVDLDTDISKYLGFEVRNPNYPDTIITARMLLSHTSSLRDGSVYSIGPEYSVKEFFDKNGLYYNNGDHFAPAPSIEDPRDQKPGVFFHYSNLNFGTLGTIIEKVSGQRFDIYMKENVLEPMGIDASYNVGDFDAELIKNVSVLYQKCNDDDVWNTTGPWAAKIDDYKGVVQDPGYMLVTNPDLAGKNTLASLENYKIGTNATIFSPQGGLRITAKELSTLMTMFMNDGTVNGKQILKPETVDLMFSPQWTYAKDATTGLDNGDTYWGLMECYGLSIQIMGHGELDRLVADKNVKWAGHYGEAYGLLSGMFIDREKGNGIVYIMNGMGNAESENAGLYSGMYRWEEKFCTALIDNLFPEL